jgi:hypothetical protein
VTRRPLVFVLGLTVGDYLVWNWSLNGNHDVLALISGLTLPPLALASLWILAITLARLVGAFAGRSERDLPAVRMRSRGYRAQAAPPPGPPSGGAQPDATPASRKIAA